VLGYCRIDVLKMALQGRIWYDTEIGAAGFPPAKIKQL